MRLKREEEALAGDAKARLRSAPRRLRATLMAALAAALLFLGFSPGALANESAAGAKDPARKITSQLICPCSCGEILSGCTCETGKAMQAFVSDGLKTGKTKDQIVASLVAKYGAVIRGAPKAEGFNLVVWIAPFAATLLDSPSPAGSRRWVRRRLPRRPRAPLRPRRGEGRRIADLDCGRAPSPS
jgi:cytochrome c-type biogenesis protein CcmH